MKQYLLFLSLSFFSAHLFGQAIGTNITACTGTFTDSGGAGGNYANSENLTSVICPDVAGELISLDFTSFNTESGFDILEIDTDNDGAFDSASSGTELDGIMVTSTNVTTGCIAFRFMSDGGVTDAGWEASISCVTPCSDPTAVMASSSTATVCPSTAVVPGAAVSFDATGSAAAAGFSLTTYEWDFGDGNTASTATPTTTHTYSTPGVYLASLTVRDDNTDIDPLGCSSSNAATRVVIVSEAPNFTGTSATQNINCFESVTLDGVAQSQQVIQTPPEVTIPPTGLPDGSGLSYEIPLDYTGLFPMGATVTATCTPTLCVNLEHSFAGDLTIELQAPDGTTVLIMDRFNGGDDFGSCVNGADDGVPGCTAQYCFADGAGVSIDGVTNVDSPDGANGNCSYTGLCEGAGGTTYIPSGTYDPTNPMSGFIGSPLNGVWTIIVTDNASSDDGTIDAASLEFDPMCFSPLLADNPDINTDATTFWSADAGNPAVVTIPAQTNTSVSYTSPDPLCANVTPADGCDGNTVTNSITIGPFSTEGAYTFTYRVEDVNGCQYEQDVVVNVAACPTFTFGFFDPCSCRSDGTFDEVAGISGPSGFDVYVTSVTGDINGVLSPLPLLLSYDAAANGGAGGYPTPEFQHDDNAGYTINYEVYLSGESAAGGDTPIDMGIGSNLCAYPVVDFTPMGGAYETNDSPVNLVGSSAPALTNEMFTFTGTGVSGTTFDPATAGAGTHTVTMAYTADDDGNVGISPDGGTTPAYPAMTTGCIEVMYDFMVTQSCNANNGTLSGSTTTPPPPVAPRPDNQ